MLSMTLAGIDRPLTFGDAASGVADALRAVLVGWPVDIATATRQRGFLHVDQMGDAYVVEAADGFRWKEPSAVSAVCTIVVALVDRFVLGRPNFGSLHAASAEYAGRLVVFPATRRAGKSTLMAHLSASGRRVHADDLLPVDLDGGTGWATGCLTRLRLPFPADAPAQSHAFLDRHTLVHDGYYAYLKPPAELCVPHGTETPLGAVVILDRTNDAAATLSPVEPGEALLKLLMQDARSSRIGAETLAAYHRLASSLPTFRLVYSDLEKARRCLDEAFCDWAQSVGSGQSMPVAGETILRMPPLKPGGYARAPGVEMRRAGDHGFLARSGDADIFHLNPIGVGVWNALSSVSTVDEIVDLFAEAFPEMPRKVLASDIRVLLTGLERADFIVKL